MPTLAVLFGLNFHAYFENEAEHDHEEWKQLTGPRDLNAE